MSILTDQQREELQCREGFPVAVLVEEGFEPRELYPLIAKTAAEAGWSEPAMDAYGHYDEQRDQG